MSIDGRNSPLLTPFPQTSLYERLPEVIGTGAFSKVYKGRHRLTGASVAIKVFNPEGLDDEKGLAARFQHTVRCFERLANYHQPGVSSMVSEAPSGFPSKSGVSSPGQGSEPSGNEQASIKESMFSQPASFRPTRETLEMVRMSAITKELVVSLLDYSRTQDGRPGKEAGEYFLVVELGDCSLEEYIERRERAGQRFSVEEVRFILRDVARVACLLHFHGLAHLDIKPANIMLFNSTFWKLIDFDGCFMASAVVDVSDSDIAFTPLYCAPEIADSIVSLQAEFKVSRLMDVWSIGMIASELVQMRPLLEPQYMKLLAKNSDDDTEFLRWLSDKSLFMNIEFVRHFDQDLYSALRDRILVKDVTRRASLPEILQLKFFKSHSMKRFTWIVHAAIPNSTISKSTRLLPIDKNRYVYVVCHK